MFDTVINLEKIHEMERNSIIYPTKSGHNYYGDEAQQWWIYKFRNSDVCMKISPYYSSYTTPYSYINFLILVSKSPESSAEIYHYIEETEAAEKLLSEGINICFDLELFNKYAYVFAY